MSRTLEANIGEGLRDVILYFGSFNPMHVGHLCLCNFVTELYPEKELWIVLTGDNPFKTSQKKLSPTDRIEWIRYLTKDYPTWHLCLEELALPHPHYTYRTLEYLQERYPTHHFTLLLGADTLEDLPRWMRGDSLLQEQSFIVYPRPGYVLPEWANSYSRIMYLQEAPLLSISSTMIREWIIQGHDLPYFLHTSPSDPHYRRLRKALLALRESE